MRKMEIKIFGIKAVICKSFFSKFRGLMFRRRKDARALFFVFPREQIIALHMFFVFFPIKAILLNSNKQIIGKKTLKPFQIWMPEKKIRYILEVPL